MIKHFKWGIVFLLVVFMIWGNCAYAHSGRTDSQGGHYNRSTGEYHYHHGYPEHQHYNGLCPYEDSAQEEDYTEERIVEIETRSYEQEKIDNLLYRIGELNDELSEVESEYDELKWEKLEYEEWLKRLGIACIIESAVIVILLFKRKK